MRVKSFLSGALNLSESMKCLVNTALLYRASRCLQSEIKSCQGAWLWVNFRIILSDPTILSSMNRQNTSRKMVHCAASASCLLSSEGFVFLNALARSSCTHSRSSNRWSSWFLFLDSILMADSLISEEVVAVRVIHLAVYIHQIRNKCFSSGQGLDLSICREV